MMPPAVPSNWTDFSSPHTPTYPGAYAAQPTGYGYPAAYAGYGQSTPAYPNAYAPYGYGAAATPYMMGGYPQPDTSSALVLYNPTGTLASFNQTPTKSNTNPFTPGLDPLPAVPAPVTFVEANPVNEKFPATTRQKDEVLGWITPTILGDTTEQVHRKLEEKKVSLKELKEHNSLTSTHAFVHQFA